MKFLVLSLCLLSSLVSASVKFHVFAPDELSRHYKYQQLDITVANYGYIPYGQSLIGNLYFANPRNACLPLSSTNMTESSPIMVIERGGCHFVTKSHYAQLFGARMAIIIDNEVEKEASVLMIDDGYGFDIHIPTIMISKNDGDMIQKFMNDQTVSISFEFVAEKREDFVNLEFWMSSYDEKSYDFLLKFRNFHSKMPQNVASFTPRFALWVCQSCKDMNYTISSDSCLSNGRYCLQHESKSPNIVSGSEIVFEDLTQLCLYDLNRNQWWSYIEDFLNTCLRSKFTHDLKTCSEELYTRHQYDKQKVEMCINDSFIDRALTNKHDGENILLARELKSFMTEGIQSWPTLRINNETYRENLQQMKGVITAICQAYPQEMEFCKQELGETLSKKKVANTVKQDEGGVSTTTFVIVSVVTIVLLILILLFIYQRKLRKEMSADLQNQVNSHLSKYFSLSGERKDVSTV